jgi:hypothetical protein
MTKERQRFNKSSSCFSNNVPSEKNEENEEKKEEEYEDVEEEYENVELMEIDEFDEDLSEPCALLPKSQNYISLERVFSDPFILEPTPRSPIKVGKVLEPPSKKSDCP